MLAALALVLLQAPVSPDTLALRIVLDSTIPALMQQHRIPGAALVVVRDTATLALRGYGRSDIDTERPVDPERTIFRIASVAKLFTTVAALQQVERGRLDLTGDLRPLLPEIPIRGGSDAPVRLHDLLTHSAGFEERLVGMAARTPAELRPLGEYLAARMPRRDATPGTRTSYSNHGFALAGYAVERAAGRDFTEYAAAELFAPLGMTRTSFRRPPGDHADLATGYVCDGGRCKEGPPAFSHTYPAGLAYSTAGDMRRFLLAVLHPEGPDASTALSTALVSLMLAEQFTHDATLDGMGYGFWRHRWRTGDLLLSHAGNVPGFVTLVQLAPDQRLGFFLATNGNASAFPRLVSEALLEILLPGAPLLGPDRTVAADDLGRFAGTYRLTRTARRNIETFPTLFQNPLRVTVAGDTLTVHRSSGPVHFLRTGPLRFTSRDGLHRLAFRNARSGRITLLMGGQPAFGGEFPAAWERLAWHDEPGFMNEYVSWLAGLPPIVLLAWGVLAIARWVRRRRGRESRRQSVPRYALGLTVLWTVLFLAVAFGLIARSTRLLAGPMVYGLTPHQVVLAQTPWLLGVIAILLVGATWRAWRQRCRLGGLMCLTGVTLTALASLAFLVRWGYLPASW